MKCPRCQHENRPGAKFCEECGLQFSRRCGHCGAELSPTAKFCSECGSSADVATATRLVSPESYTPKHLAEKILTSKASLEGERKQVTVLFADFKGSMELLAARYKSWANEIADSDRRSAFLACADREEDIARRVEALYPAAASIQGEILARNPDLTSITGSLFSAYPLGQQIILQARGERFGAATWRSFAQDEQSPEARKVFLECAVLEEESAAFLESISGGQA